MPCQNEDIEIKYSIKTLAGFASVLHIILVRPCD